MALVLAIAVNSSSLESGFLNLLVVLFVGFLVFSLIVMRRVSRSDASSSGGKGG